MIGPVTIDGGAKGYVRLYRKMLDNPLFTNKPAAWLKIWIFILLRVNWKESIFKPRRGEPIKIPAGSMITSLDKLAHTPDLTREHARKCLEYLKRTHTITLKSTHHWTMITVVNWPSYQQLDTEAEHTAAYAGEHANFEVGSVQGTHARTHVRTLSKESNKNSTTLSKSGDLDLLPGIQPNLSSRTSRSGIDPEIHRWFDAEFWPIYPRHEAKSTSLKAAAKKATTAEKRAFYLERLNAQLPEYKRRKAEKGQSVIPLGATWFNADRAEDELPVPELINRNSRPAPAESDYSEYVPFEARKTGN